MKKAIKKVLLDIPFDTEKWHISYEEMFSALKAFLQELLSVNTPTTVGHFKSYIWRRYKVDIEYKESGVIMLHLWFLDTLTNQRKTKQKIIAFMEWLKKKPEICGDDEI